jgi:hypothetical protein
MATYSNNTTIKVGDTISYRRVALPSQVFSETYTVPAGSYLIVHRAENVTGFGSTSSLTYQIPGQIERGLQSSEYFQYVTNPSVITETNPHTRMLPAGTIIRMNANGGPLGGASYDFAGQIFINTP